MEQQEQSIPPIVTDINQGVFTAANTEVTNLANEFLRLNREANDLANKAEKARKALYLAMLDAKLTSVEADGAYIDRFAKESSSLDPLKVKDYLTPEQFWATASFTKTAVEKFIPDAILEKCSVVKTSTENVHIRKK